MSLSVQRSVVESFKFNGKTGGLFTLRMWARTLWALICQKLLVIMMMTTLGEWFERLS